mmetsp:Transcript_8050/g.26547  ORF Transcript_8050/g.26547 Transcript_8050/m.26547 type:complete len:153 (+) Transcript_8050:1155-1613(+)
MSRFNAFVDCTCTLVHSSSFFIRVSSANVPGPSSSSASILVFERNASTSSSLAGRAMHRTFESSSSKTPHPSSSLHDDDDGDFERLLRLSLFPREEDEVLNEEGKGARRRAGAQRRISRDDDDDVATPRVELFSRHQNVASTNASRTRRHVS